jgi:hypothetical protein
VRRKFFVRTWLKQLGDVIVIIPHTVATGDIKIKDGSKVLMRERVPKEPNGFIRMMDMDLQPMLDYCGKVSANTLSDI